MKDKPYEVRGLTNNDIKSFYGQGLKTSSRGWSIYYEDKLFAICGVTFGKSVIIGFSDIDRTIEIPDITIWRMAKDIMKKVDGLGYKDIFAVADEKENTSKAFLRRLGFKPVHSGNGKVFRYGSSNGTDDGGKCADHGSRPD